MDKGTVSNLVSAVVFAVGFFAPSSTAQAFLFSAGIFALSGGLTNWLAVKMLFDRVPGLIGSGVIPARFKEIRAKVRDLILEHFFSEAYLADFFENHQKDVDWSRYLKKADGRSPISNFVERQWNQLTSAEVVQPIIDQQINRLTESSVGGMLLMVGMDSVRPAVNEFVSAFVASMQDRVMEAAGSATYVDLQIEIDEEVVVADVRSQVEGLLETKLHQLSPEDVKCMMEDVMRRHLGWLIVWGNVFGGAIGIVAFALKRMGWPA
ncbi:MAG: DUF445 domain-containing protein [Planctomycetes bacterium]|nr:DUF445 domain-containing protein [Planctomycetota bacterium]